MVVLGGTLAGMAAAARLAKAGHAVTLLEGSDRLGGRWAARTVDGVLLDFAPSVLEFPAPWRDLFRKSGRPLEAELSRTGHALVPAPPACYQFADGEQLRLPTDRGERYETFARQYGPTVAGWWRDRLDALEPVWQAVRQLGLEAELVDRHQLAAVKQVLQPRRTLADLADRAPHPHLAALLRSVGYRMGSDPDRTPMWCAVDLFVTQTFGRWTVVGGHDTGRSSVLTEVLARRLELRHVAVHYDRPVTHIQVTRGRVVGVQTADGADLAAGAVVATSDPWQLAGLLPPRTARRTLGGIRRLRPALAPAVTASTLATDPSGEPPGIDVSERVALTAVGLPSVTYQRPVTDGWLQVTHDYRQARPDRAVGASWHRFSDWLRRPPTTTEVAGLFVAGPHSRSGNGPAQVILSGALASAACSAYLERG